MGKWGNGEMGKWGISAKTLKPQHPKTPTANKAPNFPHR
jgi:hypothetical protein